MKKVTIKDVAKKAGVSISTASFALNNVKGRVSSEIREHVLRCAEELNYTANANARTLRTSLNNMILFAYGEMFLFERNASTMFAISGALKFANENGKEILVDLLSTNNKYDDILNKYIKIWTSSKVEGMIFLCHFEDERDELLYNDLYKAGVNLVNLSLLGRASNHPSIYQNESEITKKQVEFALSKGYTDIYYMGKKSIITNPRVSGFNEIIKKESINGKCIFYESYNRTKDDMWEMLEPVVKLGRRFAVLCWNDIDAINLMELFISKGLEIPKDVGVMGFGDMPIAEHVSPSLTTVSQPIDNMAFQACELLKLNSAGNNFQSIQVSSKIIERSSM